MLNFADVRVVPFCPGVASLQPNKRPSDNLNVSIEDVRTQARDILFAGHFFCMLKRADLRILGIGRYLWTPLIRHRSAKSLPPCWRGATCPTGKCGIF